MTRRVPLLASALGFAAGGALPTWFPAWIAAAALPLSLSPPLVPLAFAAAGLLAGRSVAVAPASPSPPGRGEPEGPLAGRVASVPERVADRVRFVLRERAGGLVQVSAPPPRWPLAWGDEVLLRARRFAADGPRNPGGRDLAGLLAARGIADLASARTPPARSASPAALSWLESGRSRFAAAADAALPAREAALVRAIGAGDRSAIDPATNEAFARSGLAHLLSVSGLHLAVVALGAFRALRALLLARPWLASRVDARRTAAALALPVAALYAVATGADVPVVRSALAAGLGFAGVLFDRESSALSALAVGLLAVLAIEPGAALDVSLQLSFASVAGLALLTGPLRRGVRWKPPLTLAGRAAEAGLSSLAASLAATAATVPLVAYHFRRVSLLSAAANLAGVPLGSALTLCAATAAAAAAVAPGPALPFLWLCHPLAWLLLRVNDLFAAPDAAVLGVASPGLMGLAASYAGLALALAGSRRARWAGAALALAGLVGPDLARAQLAARRGLLEVIFLSVGQGDAALLRLPDGAAVLVDGGGDPQGRYDPGARDVLPLLRDAGVRRPWLAVLTHPHADHLLGLASVGAAMPPVVFASSGRGADDAIGAAALARLPAPLVLRRGAVLARAGVRFRVLGPPPDVDEWSQNDASLVLRVEHGEVTFLLLGDVEAEGEAALLASGEPLRADVVKVAHHGARTSSTPALIGAVRPAVAVLSLARHNGFGFPAPEVVERWRRAGAAIARTDEGAVRFLSDGSRVWRAPAEGAIDAWAMWRERGGRENRDPDRDRGRVLDHQPNGP